MSNIVAGVVVVCGFCGFRWGAPPSVNRFAPSRLSPTLYQTLLLSKHRWGVTNTLAEPFIKRSEKTDSLE